MFYNNDSCCFPIDEWDRYAYYDFACNCGATDCWQCHEDLIEFLNYGAF